MLPQGTRVFTAIRTLNKNTAEIEEICNAVETQVVSHSNEPQQCLAICEAKSQHTGPGNRSLFEVVVRVSVS